jgi:putative tricarboxylic transport membrane protein
VAISKKDAYAGVALIILAIAYWLGADGIKQSVLGGTIGADALPKMLGIALGLLSLILILQTLLGARKAKAEADDEPQEPFSIRPHLRAAGMLLIGVGYVVLVEILGYIPGIAYLLGGVVLFVGGASRRTTILFAVIGALLFWAFFVYVLDIRQPKGIWPDLWKAVQTSQFAPAQFPLMGPASDSHSA